MGWSGGNDIVSRVAREVNKVDHKPSSRYAAVRVLCVLIDACRDCDADDLYELEGESEILDEALRLEGVIGDEN